MAKRKIDNSFAKNYAKFSKRFSLVKKSKIGKLKMMIVVAFLLGGFIAIFWGFKNNFYSDSGAAVAPGVICDKSGKSATIVLSDNYDAKFAFRYDKDMESWNGKCDTPEEGDICDDNAGSKHVVMTTPGKKSRYWAHKWNGSGPDWNSLIGPIEFACQAATSDTEPGVAMDNSLCGSADGKSITLGMMIDSRDSFMLINSAGQNYSLCSSYDPTFLLSSNNIDVGSGCATAKWSCSKSGVASRSECSARIINSAEICSTISITPTTPTNPGCMTYSLSSDFCLNGTIVDRYDENGCPYPTCSTTGSGGGSDGDGGSTGTAPGTAGKPASTSLCGSDNGKLLNSTPVNLCSSGEVPTISQGLATNIWKWSCHSGSKTANCVAYPKISVSGGIWFTANNQRVDGQCGSASGNTTTIKPATNLCSAGRDSGVIFSEGTWRWACLGYKGKTNASCQAKSSPGIL